jgi:hypothetical protein
MPEVRHVATIRGLPIDPVEAEPRQVFFFDTPDLALNAAGMVVRARRRPGGRADTVIKLRPISDAILESDLRRNPAFGVEADVLPGGFVCSGSFKGRCTSQEVRDVALGALPVRKLFSRDQRAFFAEHAPAGLTLDDLAVLGPIFTLRSVFAADLGEVGGGGVQRMIAELWLYPDGSRILELSTKCEPRDAVRAAGETRAWFASRGIDVTGTQQTKTRAALEYHAAQLAATRTPAEAAADTQEVRP